jgi:hypothetical protein
MADVKADFKDVWNAVTDVATLIDSDTSSAMGSRAFVVPKGLQPWDLDWSEQFDRDLAAQHRWGNLCSDEYLDLGLFSIEVDCSPTLVRCGASYKAGGRYEGKGRYIHDAYLWALADSTAMGCTVNATGYFSSTPVTVANGVAQLTGSIHIKVEQFGMHFTDLIYDVLLQGDGYCALTPR